jgi:hypothetical protein
MSFRTNAGNFARVGGGVYIRVTLATIFAGIVFRYLTGYFADMAKTDHWILQHHFLIRGMLYFVAFIVWIGFLSITRTPKAKSQHEGTP